MTDQMSFKDQNGRSWLCKIVYSTVQRVRAQLNLDLMDLKFMQKLADEIVTRIVDDDVLLDHVRAAATKIGLARLTNKS